MTRTTIECAQQGMTSSSCALWSFHHPLSYILGGYHLYHIPRNKMLRFMTHLEEETCTCGSMLPSWKIIFCETKCSWHSNHVGTFQWTQKKLPRAELTLPVAEGSCELIDIRFHLAQIAQIFLYLNQFARMTHLTRACCLFFCLF